MDAALSAIKGLAAPACGLSDGSVAGDWRMPNVKELQSLIHFDFTSPALSNAAGTGQWAPGDPFSTLCLGNYWSSTNFANNPELARVVSLSNGNTFSFNTADVSNVCAWAVRGGR